MINSTCFVGIRGSQKHSLSVKCNIASVVDSDFALAAPMLGLQTTFSASQLRCMGLKKMVQSIKPNLGQYATLSFCLFRAWLFSEWTTSQEGSCNGTSNAQSSALVLSDALFCLCRCHVCWTHRSKQYAKRGHHHFLSEWQYGISRRFDPSYQHRPLFGCNVLS